MNTPPSNDFESLRQAAIAVAVERTSDIHQCGADFCFTSISRNGITQEFVLSSERHAEWRLLEERIYISADIMRIDLYPIIEEVWLGNVEARDRPETCPPVVDWTEWLPKTREGWDEITPPHFDTDLVVTRVTKRE